MLVIQMAFGIKLGIDRVHMCTLYTPTLLRRFTSFVQFTIPCQISSRGFKTGKLSHGRHRVWYVQRKDETGALASSSCDWLGDILCLIRVTIIHSHVVENWRDCAAMSGMGYQSCTDYNSRNWSGRIATANALVEADMPIAEVPEEGHRAVPVVRARIK